MLDRFWPRALFLVALAAPIAGCTNQLVDTISVSPTAQTISAGQTFQFTATGIVGHGTNHPSTTSNITDQVTWTSSLPSVATINSSGVATAVGTGSTMITATINGYTGTLSASATLSVSSSGGGVGSVTGITSLSVIPGSQSVATPGQTSQFIAIGTNSAGATVDLTNQVTWSSSSVQIATVGGNTGLATAVNQGTVTITALYANPNGGSIITGTGTFTVTSGTSQQFTSVEIIPNSQSVSASGQTGQFIAIATLGSSGLEEDVTNSPNITWISSIPTIATVTSGLASGNGVVTGASVGTTNITVELQNPTGGVVTGTAQVSVALTAPPEPLLSLQVIPSSITVNNLEGTGNFLAVGTFSTVPYVRDLTNTVTWLSDAPEVFPVSSDSAATNPGAPGGVVTAEGSGNAVIIAEATSTDGTIQTATGTFNCPYVAYVPYSPGNPNANPPIPPTQEVLGSCNQETIAPGLLVTLTVYNEGLNTSNWEVTAPSATQTPDVLHCGPGWTLGGGGGGSVCTATYPLDTTVTLTAPDTGAAFGGWSYNCTPSDASGNPLPGPVFWTAAGPNYCTVTLGGGTVYSSNVTVGAIFN